MNQTTLHLPIQFFAEGDIPQETPAAPSALPDQAVDYEALYQSDKTLQSWLDGKLTKATKTAVDNAQKKWQRLNDERLTEAERLQTMTAEEKAEYYRKKFEEAQMFQEREKNARLLEQETGRMFAESGIPMELLATIDFSTATAEDVKARTELFSRFDLYPKGAFEEKLKATLDEKLRQKSPVSPGKEPVLSGVEAAFYNLNPNLK